MEIIPAIYILDGRCVALYKGSFEQKTSYYQSPVDMARFFQRQGAQKLHLVDLNSKKEGHFIQAGLIKKISGAVDIPVQVEASFGNMEDIGLAFQSGASKVVLRPFAFNVIQEAVKTYGPEKVIVEIQSKGSGVIGDGKTSDGEPIDVVDFAEKLVPLGIKEIVFKDERSEGTLMQPNYDEVDRLFLITGNDLKIYVSGGISDPKHLRLLKKIGAAGAIIGKAFFERTISIAEAQAAVRD